MDGIGGNPSKRGSPAAVSGNEITDALIKYFAQIMTIPFYGKTMWYELAQ